MKFSSDAALGLVIGTIALLFIAVLIYAGVIEDNQRKERCQLSFNSSTTAQDSLLVMTASNGGCMPTLHKID